MTVAAFMDLALYDPSFGYYARSARRSGVAGDFFTSVDVGALFGELLESQIAEMAGLLAKDGVEAIDLVEAGAGNGRLSADILRSTRRHHPSLYGQLRLHLIEASPVARAAQRQSLGETADCLVTSSPDLPDRINGIVFANELLDAMPTHQVVMRAEGLREVYVGPQLALREGPLSTPALAAYLERLDVTLEPGWRVEINLRAVEWIRALAERMDRGFVILIDYGHEARELYSVAHSSGTLTTFARHTAVGPESMTDGPMWLSTPASTTSPRMWTSPACGRPRRKRGWSRSASSIRRISCSRSSQNLENLENLENLKKRLALKTLIMPGGLGSTMKVLILGKGVGRPALRGCSFAVRAT